MKKSISFKKALFGISLVLYSFTAIYSQNTDSLLLLTQSTDPQIRAEAYASLGNNRNLPASERLEYAQKSLEIAKEQNDKSAEAYANYIAGSAYTDAGEYDKAVSCLQNSIILYDALKDLKMKARSLDVLGRTYFYLRQPAKSLEMMQKSNAIKLTLGDPHEIAWSNIGLGNVHAIMGNLDEALELFLESQKILERLHETENISKVYNNIGNIYFAKGEMNKVLPYRLKALELDRAANDERQIAFKTYNMAEYYLAVNEAGKALPYLEESINLAEKLQDKELKLDNLKLFTEYYILINDHNQALEYFKNSFLLSEDLFSSELSEQVSEMQALFETEQAIKEKQISELNLAKSEEEKNVLLLLFIVAILVLGIFIFIYHQKKKFNILLKAQVKQKTLELEEANIELKNNVELLIKAKEKAEESDRLKSAFLANMSHEVRTPMNGILGFTKLLLKPDLSSEEKDSYINIVHKSGQRMLNTVNDIVEMSKIEAGLVDINEEETDFNKHARHILDLFSSEAENKGLKISAEELLAENDKILNTDPHKLDTILANLIKNAIKYTSKGSISLKCHRKGNEIECAIADTGIGIPKNRHKAIFEHFTQADIEDKNAYEGVGLGLSVCKAYVEMLGGKISVESEEGKGSIFYFTLPYAEKLD